MCNQIFYLSYNFLDFAAYYISGGALNGIHEALAAQSPVLFFSKKDYVVCNFFY